MSAISWKTGVNGDWSDAADWAGGNVPGSGDAVTVAASGIYTLTISSAEAANTVVLNASGAEILDSSSLAIGTSLSVTSGTFGLSNAGSVSVGTVTLNSAAAGTINVGKSGIVLSTGGSTSLNWL